MQVAAKIRLTYLEPKFLYVLLKILDFIRLAFLKITRDVVLRNDGRQDRRVGA